MENSASGDIEKQGRRKRPRQASASLSCYACLWPPMGHLVADANTIEIYSDVLVVLGTAGIVVPLVRRWGVSPILGYLGTGAVLGPSGLGSLIQNFPFLYWFTIVDAQNVTGLAELGVDNRK